MMLGGGGEGMLEEIRDDMRGMSDFGQFKIKGGRAKLLFMSFMNAILVIGSPIFHDFGRYVRPLKYSP